MINQILAIVLGVSIPLFIFGLAVDHSNIIGVCLIVFLASSVTFILNWKNRWRSVLATTYAGIVFFGLKSMASSGSLSLFSFHPWTMVSTLIVIPLILVLSGILMSDGKLFDRIIANVPYILCIIGMVCFNLIGAMMIGAGA